MKTSVQTVLGEKPIRELGFTLMHEHILSAGPGLAWAYPQLINDGYPERTGIGYANRILATLKEAKAAGVDSILEMTPYDLGRNALLMKELSEKSGINIIACTGWYKEQKLVVGCLKNYAAERFAEVFVHDLTVGMEGTDIKAEFLKTACEKDGMTPEREVIHRACAMAAKETGSFIVLHQDAGAKTAYEQLRVLKEEGVDMRRVKVDHVLDTTDRDYVRWIGEQGVWMGADRLPTWRLPGILPNDVRYENIKALIEMGFADQLLFGHDSACLSMGADAIPPNEEGLNGAANPYGLTWLKRITMPKLIEMGVDEAVVDRIAYENPTRFFTGE